jgi:hypothetical protein
VVFGYASVFGIAKYLQKCLFDSKMRKKHIKVYININAIQTIGHFTIMLKLPKGLQGL